MSLTRILGILLIAGGALGLAYGGFSYTKQTHSTRLGPIVLQVQDRETVYVPLLLSAGAIALGTFLLLGLKRE